MLCGWQNRQRVKHFAILKNFVMQMRAGRSSGAANIANVGSALNHAVLCHKPFA
jgi:hypothetical protein